MKKITILKHSRGELANQLWNYISISAYSFHVGVKVENPSFFEYHSYFNFLRNEGWVTKFFSFWFKNGSGRRNDPRNRFWRKAYSVYASIVQSLFRARLVSSENERSEVVYLPPTAPAAIPDQSYFIGWLFRNPIGLKKFRKELISAFTPNSQIEGRVTKIIVPLRENYEHIVGVHIRQADYIEFKGGIYYVSQTRAKEIIDEYVSKNGIDRSKTLFLIASDGPIDTSIFRNLNVYISKENAVTDLFLLSSTDVIIGSDSSFGAFASWYGNIPHVVMTKNPMDWNYYTDKKEYFENKYGKMVRN